ncbi:MAG: hypothetical protein WC565_08320 [Parcubacteria group bacterium]
MTTLTATAEKTANLSGQVVVWKGFHWSLNLEGNGNIYRLRAFGLGGGYEPRLGRAIVAGMLASGEMVTYEPHA